MIEDPHPVAPVATRLKKRPDFLRVARGRKNHSSLFTVQGVMRVPDYPAAPRVGFTVTKKVGGSVERNRIKRRLREAVRLASDLCLKPDHDYVVIARRDVLTAPFPALTAGLMISIRKLHAPSSRGRATRAENRIDHRTNGS